MNNLKDQTVLIIYDGSNAKYQDYTSAALAYEATGWTAELMDVDGLDDTLGGGVLLLGEIYDLVAALTNGTYDKIIITCTIDPSPAAAEQLNYRSLALLRSKLKTASQAAVTVETGTAQAGATTYIRLAATASTDDDYYNTLFVVTTGGTNSGQTRVCMDYDAAGGAVDQLCLVSDDADLNWLAPDNTTTYAIYNETNIFIAQDPSLIVALAYRYNVKAVTYGDSALTWDYIRTNSVTGIINTYPRLVHCIGSGLYSILSATCSGAGAATTLVDAGAFTASAHIGQYVYIISGTGAGQWANILSNTTGALTCQYFNNADADGFPNYRQAPTGGNAAWTTNLDNTSVYAILDGFEEILHAQFYQLYIKSYLNDITAAANQVVWTNLVDESYYLSDDVATVGPPIQDTDAIDTALTKGQAIYRGILVTAALT